MLVAIGMLTVPGLAVSGSTPQEDCQAVRDRDHQIWRQLVDSLPPGSPIPPEPVNPCIAEDPSRMPGAEGGASGDTPGVIQEGDARVDEQRAGTNAPTLPRGGDAVIVSPRNFDLGVDVEVPGEYQDLPFVARDHVTPAYVNSGGANKNEVRYCSVPSRIRICKISKDLASEASREAEARFSGDSLHNGQGDAFRHCVWAGYLTLELGEGKAKEFTDRHEELEDPNHPEVRMDLQNNATGISIGKRVGRAGGGKSGVVEQCEQKARSGELVTLK